MIHCFPFLLTFLYACHAYIPLPTQNDGHFSPTMALYSSLQTETFNEEFLSRKVFVSRNIGNELLAQSIRHWEQNHGGLRYNPEDTLKLIQKIARQLASGQDDVEDDLVQEGVIGLMLSMQHYPLLENNDESFDEFSKRYILYEMSRILNPEQKQKFAALLLSIQRKQSNIKKKQKELEASMTFGSSIETTTENDFDEVIRTFINQDSFDKANSKSPGIERSWFEPALLQKEKSFVDGDLNPEDEVLQNMLRSDVDKSLLRTLNELELKVIRLRFYGEALSSKEVAKCLRMTPQFVQIIEKQAIQKLRTISSSRSILEPYRYVINNISRDTRGIREVDRSLSLY